MKKLLLTIMLLTGFNIAYATGDGLVSKAHKAQILEVIHNGSNRLDYPMGAMPGGLVAGADAEEIAAYVAGGMKGEQPASFAACSSCHGEDGKGMYGMTPNLVEFANKKLTQNIIEEPKEEKSWIDKMKDVYDKLTQTVPKCSDESVIELVHQLHGQMREENIKSLDFASAAILGATIPKSISRIDMIRSTGYDESIEKRSCKADAIFESKGKEITVELTYSVQLNEQNSEEFYVFLEPDYMEALSQKLLASLLRFGR